MSLEVKIQCTPPIAQFDAGEKIRRAFTPEGKPTRLLIDNTRFKLVETWQDHLKAQPPNKMGWPSTGFWEEAADAVQGFAQEYGVVLQCNKEGITQRYHGGAITAKDKALTIPARAEYYGHHATEFHNLRLVIFKSGSAALVEADASTITFSKKARKDGTHTVTRGETGALVAYWLVKRGDSTRVQAANSTIVPKEKFEAVVVEGIVETVKGGT